MRNKIKWVACFLLITLILSCKKEKAPAVYYGYDYFPSNVGHYVIYQVDSVYKPPISSSKKWDTVIYQVKEVIDSLYPDNLGNPTMRIKRYRRNSVDSSWNGFYITVKVWYGNLTASNAQRVEDNYRYVKLIFPVALDAQWNGNIYNTLGAWNYHYTAVNNPLILNNLLFDSTLTVLQNYSVNLLQRQYYMEQYATNVGLIYKQIIDTLNDTVNFDNSLNVLYTETYISSGNQ